MVPLQIRKTLLSGQTLSELSARITKTVGNPRQIISERANKHRFHSAFKGDLVVSIYESGPATLRSQVPGPRSIESCRNWVMSRPSVRNRKTFAALCYSPSA